MAFTTIDDSTGRVYAIPMTHDEMRDSILTWYCLASDNDYRKGISWYSDANLIARECDNVVTGAGVLAALSPRMPWSRNVALARIAFNKASLIRGGLGNSLRATNAIVAGKHPLEVLNGLKTRAFFDNILNPIKSNEVTIDTHAIKIAGINKDAVNKGDYLRIADAYREAAEWAEIAPLDMQAVTWTAYRRINRIDWRDIRA